MPAILTDFLPFFPVPPCKCLENLKLNKQINICTLSRYSVVGTATGYGLDNQGVGVRAVVGSRIFSSPRRPDVEPTHPPIHGYCGLFPQGQSGRGVKLTTHLQLVLRSRKCGSIHPLSRTPSWHSV
jgi:hypothetical protein